MNLRPRRRLLFAGAFVGLFAGFVLAGCVTAGIAFAFWTFPDSSNLAVAIGDSINDGAVPVLSGVDGQTVTLSWGAATTLAGKAVDGHTVSRYATTSGGNPVAGTAGCQGAIVALSCTEQNVPTGTWYYAVTPRIALWAGAESGRRSVSVVAPIDTTAPVLTVTAWGANVAATGATVFVKTPGTGSFTIAASDPESGVSTSTFSAAPTGWTVTGSGNARTYTLGAGPLFGSIVVSATNFAGMSSGNRTITITLDTIPPTLTSFALGPVDNITSAGFLRAGGQYYAYANASDAGSGVATILVNVTNITAGQTAAPLVAGSYSAFGTTYNYRSAALTADAALSAGPKSWTRAATDRVGNTLPPASASVTVDNTAPTGSITAPSGFAAASTIVSSSSTDATAGVASAQFLYRPAGSGSWVPMATDLTAPYSVAWDTTGLLEGSSYDLQVITTDNASNTLISATVPVIIDRTAPAAPSVPILTVASDSGVAGDNLTNVRTPTLTGSAAPGSVVKVLEGPDQVGTGTATDGSYAVTTSILDGETHTIIATATDGAGNTSPPSTAVTITVDIVTPTPLAVTLTNGTGTAQTVDSGDKATITYTEQLMASSVCSTWASDSTTQTLSDATVTLADSSGKTDSLTVTTGSCTLRLGTITIANYVSATTTFTSSTLSWNPATKALTITLGALAGSGVRTGVVAASPEYVPDALLTDLAGNAMAATKFTDAVTTGF